MMYSIQKRDGRTATYDRQKIINAVLAAFKSVDGIINEYAKSKANSIADYVETQLNEGLTVENIQDLVEKGLMATKRKDVAKAFILYRQERSRVRQGKSDLLKEVQKKIRATDVQNQNANIDEVSFGGRKGEAANTLMKEVALEYVMSDLSKKNHLENMIYIHDLDNYAMGVTNCLTIPFDDMLSKVIRTRQVDLRPANSLNTALQLVPVYMQITSLSLFGGVAAGHLDWTLVPFVRISFYKHYKEEIEYWYEEEFELENPREVSIDDKEVYSNSRVYKKAMKMTEKEMAQGCEGLLHNLNSLQSRSGNQLPFSSINYGTCVMTEGRMFTKAILEATLKGVGDLYRTPIFPCQIMVLGKGINRKKGDPNYDLYQLALKCSAKRLYPNYANLDWSINKGYDKNDPKTHMSTINKLVA